MSKAYGDQFAIIPEGLLDAPISANAFRLWAIFQRHSDVLGHCYPSRNRLAEMMRVSHDTIARAKRELVDAGMITCLERYDDSGRRTSDDVFLHPPRRKGASGVRRTGASVNSKAVELEPEGRTSLGCTPEKVHPPLRLLDNETRRKGAEFFRNLRTGEESQ